MRIENEELPYIPMYFNTENLAHVSGLRGPYTPALETTLYENIHLWEWAPLA